MARAFSPMIAFIGVRISWLMLERNEVLALLASSAELKATARASLLAIASRISALTLVIPTMMKFSSSSIRETFIETQIGSLVPFCLYEKINVSLLSRAFISSLLSMVCRKFSLSSE